MESPYDGSQASIKTDIGKSRFVDIKKGEKQGDMLSAILFCIALATIVLKTEEVCKSGFYIGSFTLSNLSYADDITLLNECSLTKIVNELAEIGLEINLAKTESMFTDKKASTYFNHIMVNP